jgi:hypothetical protein
VSRCPAPSPLTYLGPSFKGPIHELESAADISQSRLLTSSSPRYHPLRPRCAGLLAVQLLERYNLSNQKDDLDKSIRYSTEALIFSPRSWPAHGPKFVEVLISLSLALLCRSKVSKEPDDAFYAAKFLRHLRGPTHAPSGFLRHEITSFLVDTVAFQMELGASDVVQSLEEMAVLTHELLTSDPSGAYATNATARLVQAILPEFPEPFPEEPLNQIIKCLRSARTHKPEMREVHFSLAKCLYIRYLHTMNDDLDEAASILDELIASCSPADKLLANCQKLVAGLAMLRSVMNDNPEKSEEAIYRARAFLASASVADPLYPTWSRVLENAADNRFKNFGPIDGVEASSSSDPLPPPWPVPADVAQKTRAPDELLTGIRSNDVTDIDDAIEKGRTILASSDPSDLQAPQVFGNILFEAFKRTNKFEFLDESIHTHRQLLARRLSKFQRPSVLSQLLLSLAARSDISPGHAAQDLREVVELLPQWLNYGSWRLNLFGRFRFACYWAVLARAFQHPSVSTAYETALSLMQDTPLFAPTLQLQHANIAAVPDIIRSIPLDYASYQVGLGQLDRAIETLE